MIPFNKVELTNIEKEFLFDAFEHNITGNGTYCKKVVQLFVEKFGFPNFCLTTSGTHSLELAAILSDVKEGDEVIMPSFTFTSTANAFLLRGAKIVFAEINPDTMNIDVNSIREKITKRTKVIVPVHYAGVPCDMDEINQIAKENNLIVIEDAAQAVGSMYHGKYAGTLSDIGCFSFHATKNYVMGEGGGITIKDSKLYGDAEIIIEKGTDRSRFIRGEVDKYTWQQKGSSYVPSDLLAAVLYGQLTRYSEISQKRMSIWNVYHERLKKLEDMNLLRRPIIPEDTTHNAHIYYIILPSNEIRDMLITELKKKEIYSTFHYIPLHTSPLGKKLGYQEGDLPITEDYASRLLRLPLWNGMTKADVEQVVESIYSLLTSKH